MIKLSRRTFNAALGFGALSTALPGISFAQTTPVRGGTARIVAASEPAMLIELFQNTGNACCRFPRHRRVAEGQFRPDLQTPSRGELGYQRGWKDLHIPPAPGHQVA